MRDDIPFDVWSPIFQDIYEDPSLLIDDGGSEFVLSPLHRRLLIHLNLSKVSKRFYGLSRAIFYQDLQLNTHEALQHVATVVKRDIHVARLPRSLEFNFFEYRCSASSPRRARQMKSRDRGEISDDASPVDRSAALIQGDMVRRAFEGFRGYSPSMTKQSTQWITWSSYVGTILAVCKGVSTVKINAQADHSLRNRQRNARNYRTLFDPPDLDIKSVLTGLLECGNLRQLHFVDPSPLLDFGPALNAWRFLHELRVELSPRFPQNSELENTVFLPPPSLESLTLIVSRRVTGWPVTSDLLKCKRLLHLHLSSPNVAVFPNAAALRFLLGTYRPTLESIILDIHDNSRLADITYMFINGHIEFPHLERLHILNGTTSMAFWWRITTPVLQELSLARIDVDTSAIPKCRDKSFWETFLERQSLRNLRKLNIVHLDHGRDIFEQVTVARGIYVSPDAHPDIQGQANLAWDNDAVWVDANEVAEPGVGNEIVGPPGE